MKKARRTGAGRPVGLDGWHEAHAVLARVEGAERRSTRWRQEIATMVRRDHPAYAARRLQQEDADVVPGHPGRASLDLRGSRDKAGRDAFARFLRHRKATPLRY